MEHFWIKKKYHQEFTPLSVKRKKEGSLALNIDVLKQLCQLHFLQHLHPTTRVEQPMMLQPNMNNPDKFKYFKQLIGLVTRLAVNYFHYPFLRGNLPLKE